MRYLVLLALFALLGACSSNKDKDEEERVAKLPDYDKTIDIDRVWSRNAGSDKNRKYVEIVPAFADGVIYTADVKGRVFAFSADTGDRQWKVDTKFVFAGAVGAGNGLVLAGTSNGEVVALSAETGELLWSKEISSEVVAPPATNGSIVVAQTIDAKVFALDAKTGEVKWSYDHTAPVLSLRGTAAPIVTSTQVICAFDNGQVVSFSASDGSRTWEARAAQPKGKTDLERIVDIDGSPVVSGGFVYVSSYQGNLLALYRSQGKEIWRKAESSFYSPAVGIGRVFISTDRSRVVAFNSANGDVAWTNEQLLNREISAPIVFGDYVAVIDSDDYLHMFNVEDGSYVHRFKPKGDGFKAPMLYDNGRLFILSDDGKLSAYEVEED
ncbi:Outer membrane protein assembly factor BamB [Thalassocella blandensis]|nr:Outer membrane protein assembly factor BamB [Thalassocella blandensis]